MRIRNRSTSARSTATSCACALARSTNLRRATISCRRRSAPVSERPAAIKRKRKETNLSCVGQVHVLISWNRIPHRLEMYRMQRKPSPLPIKEKKGRKCGTLEVPTLDFAQYVCSFWFYYVEALCAYEKR